MDGWADGRTDKWTGKRINHSSEKAKSDLMLVKPREPSSPQAIREMATQSVLCIGTDFRPLPTSAGVAAATETLTKNLSHGGLYKVHWRNKEMKKPASAQNPAGECTHIKGYSATRGS